MNYHPMDILTHYGWIGFFVFLVSFFLFRKSTEWAALFSLAIAVTFCLFANVLENPRTVSDVLVRFTGLIETVIMLIGFCGGSIAAFYATKIKT